MLLLKLSSWLLLLLVVVLVGLVRRLLLLLQLLMLMPAALAFGINATALAGAHDVFSGRAWVTPPKASWG